MNDGDKFGKQEVYATIDQRLQGDDEFVDRLLEKHDGEVKKEKRRKEYTLPQIRRAAEDRTGVTIDQLRSAGKDMQSMSARRLLP